MVGFQCACDPQFHVYQMMQWFADGLAVIADAFDDRDDDAFPSVPEDVRSVLAVSRESPVRLGVRHECSTVVVVELSGYPPEWLERGFRGPRELLAAVREASAIRLWLGSFDDWSPEESLRKCRELIAKQDTWYVHARALGPSDFVAGRVSEWGRYRSAFSLAEERCLFVPPPDITTEQVHVRLPLPDLGDLHSPPSAFGAVMYRLTPETRAMVAAACSLSLQSLVLEESRTAMIVLGVFHQSKHDMSRSCARKALERCTDGTGLVGMRLVYVFGAFFVVQRLDVPSPRPFVSGLTWIKRTRSGRGPVSES